MKNSDFLEATASAKIPSESIDYAVMERSKKIKVVQATFSWSDLGSFESVYDYLMSKGHPSDNKGNMVIGCDKHTTFLGLERSGDAPTPFRISSKATSS